MLDLDSLCYGINRGVHQLVKLNCVLVLLMIINPHQLGTNPFLAIRG